MHSIGKQGISDEQSEMLEAFEGRRNVPAHEVFRSLGMGIGGHIT